MNLKKRAITMILLVAFTLSLLLTACGTSGGLPNGSNTTPGVSDTQTPDGDTTNSPDNTTEPDNTPGETEPITSDATDTPPDTDDISAYMAAGSTEIGTVSVAGETYSTAFIEFSLPEGLVCVSGTLIVASVDYSGTPLGELDHPADYYTMWTDTVDSDAPQTGTLITFIESHDRISGFEIRTAEQWYNEYHNALAMGELNYFHLDLKTELTTVDDNPAARVTWWESREFGLPSYYEFWVIDTPLGNIAIGGWSGYTMSYYEDNTKRMADIISTVRIKP